MLAPEQTQRALFSKGVVFDRVRLFCFLFSSSCHRRDVSTKRCECSRILQRVKSMTNDTRVTLQRSDTSRWARQKGDLTSMTPWPEGERPLSLERFATGSVRRDRMRGFALFFFWASSADFFLFFFSVSISSHSFYSSLAGTSSV